MFNDIVLLHRSGSALAAHSQPEAGWLQWKTCLRQIALGSMEVYEAHLPKMDEQDEVYIGDDAYRFLLQVICGLHSPLIGETEVNGQFKNAVASFELPVSPWGGQMRRFFKALFEDAKKIRQTHLSDLGSQSYGSILRRELRDLRRVHILGAGHLVQEVLPWLCKDGNEVFVHCRDTKKAAEELKAFTDIKICQMNERTGLNQAEALVIAAPLTAAWIRNWIGTDGGSRIRVVADTRGDSGEDYVADGPGPIGDRARVLTLADLLERISSNQIQLQARKRQALVAIDEAVAEKGRHVEYRPFGWEDVCA